MLIFILDSFVGKNLKSFKRKTCYYFYEFLLFTSFDMYLCAILVNFYLFTIVFYARVIRTLIFILFSKQFVRSTLKGIKWKRVAVITLWFLHQKRIIVFIRGCLCFSTKIKSFSVTYHRCEHSCLSIIVFSPEHQGLRIPEVDLDFVSRGPNELGECCIYLILVFNVFK